MSQKRKLFKSAFSLLELSIVIVIIGLLVAGVVGSKHIIAKSRIKSALSSTISSPVVGVYDNELWLEVADSVAAFGDVELSDGSNISNWFDRSNNQNKPLINSQGLGPTYSNSINFIPAVKFDANSSTNYLQVNNASFLNGTNYTIMIVEKRLGANGVSDNLLSGSVTGGTFAIGYGVGGSDSDTLYQLHSESESDSNRANVRTANNKPRVLTFTHSNSEGNKIYINTTLAKEDSSAAAKAHLSGLTTLDIGNGYNGEIGEVAIFSRALKRVEIEEIEDYMSDKFNSPNNRDIISDCSAGIITQDGCELSCSVNVNGVSNSSIADGATETLTCDGSGYDGSSLGSFTCTNGSLNSTPSVNACAINGCDSANDYLQSGNECVLGCSVSVIGSTLNSTVVANSTLVTCDAIGYDDSNVGTCISGSDVSGSCGCDDANNYTDSNSDNICEAPCVISSASITVDSDVTVLSGSTSYDCSNSGSYEGTVTYSCNDSSLTSLSGTCSEVSNEVCEARDASNNVIDPDITSVPGDTIHIFSTAGNATLICNNSISAQILVVGGGAGGGGINNSSAPGGGGGGGGVVYHSSYSITPQTYNITVGAGGPRYQNGSDSQFDSLVAKGGGKGGANNTSPSSGGSGGGGRTNGGIGANSNQPSYSGAVSYGNSGGNGYYNASCWRNGGGGGGGGAGAVGGNAQPDLCLSISDPEHLNHQGGGDGGDGIAINITGTSTYYGAGGGGSSEKVGVSGGQGGLGGGGNGERAGDNNQPAVTPATNGTGFGAGGGGSRNEGAGAGARGIVIIRYTNPI